MRRVLARANAAILILAVRNFQERERPARFFGENKGNVSGTLTLPVEKAISPAIMRMAEQMWGYGLETVALACISPKVPFSRLTKYPRSFPLMEEHTSATGM